MMSRPPKKEEDIPPGRRCGSVETCRKRAWGSHSPGLRGQSGGFAATAQLMATVTLKGVKKVYDDQVTAVHSFDLEIADKEFVVLVGPSGCGKSTTLRMIAGLEEISDGDLFIDGKRCNDVEPKDRDIAMVFQSYALYPQMTVRENMAFPLKLKKVPKAEIDKVVNEVAEVLGITEYLERKPKALSGGQRQRVAIGRAIVREPKVLLMDEPLSNLDAKLRNQMRTEITKLRSRINSTFVYVTHDQTEAMTLGDRIVIMKNGYIQQIGTPQEVFERPANIFVAGFIGMPQMNFFEDAQLAEGKVAFQGAVLALSADTAAQLDGRSGKVTVGIRPTHIKLAQAQGPDTISATVDVSEMMGSEIHLHVSAQGKDVVLVIPTTDLPTQWRGGIPFGTQIYFTAAGEHLHLFDPETGEAILR